MTDRAFVCLLALSMAVVVGGCGSVTDTPTADADISVDANGSADSPVAG